MGLYQRFCEWSTDAKYVPHGQNCGNCGNKLGFLETGFWSINAKQLTDGVLCENCYEKLVLLTEYRGRWIPRHMRKEYPFNAITSKNLLALDIRSVKTVLESPEVFGREELSAIGEKYTAIFRMQDACFIEPTPLQVGIARAKQLNNKLVLFGFVQMGEFKRGDRVVILDGGNRREASVLEAYVFDCQENDLEVMLKAHMGKQRLNQWQKGWLVLDDEETVEKHTTVIG